MGKYCNHCMSQLGANGDKCPVCGRKNTDSVPAHHLLPGSILNGKFYVGEALGEGGFGITYIGRDLKLDMKVAIKEFYPNGYVNRSNTISPRVNDSVTLGRKDFFEKGKKRFLKEAQILAKFSGEPGIVDVRDFFEENNTAYIIMEFLDGVDLKTFLKKNGTLTPEQTIRLMMPVMNSLKKVHAHGLIHRDISPDNIMIIGNKVKLLDFGAARTVSAAANKSLSVMLKPGYAPEEQYRSKGSQGPWTDIYALCATMYKCITGITPDDATQRVFSDEVKTPSALNFVIKPEVERAIMRGMSVHQTDRYQCIEDLIRGLQGIEVPVLGTGQTVAAEKNVSGNDVETVYVPNDADDKTVMENDIRTALPAKNRKQSAGKANIVHADSRYIKGRNESHKRGKSKTGFIIIAVVAAIAVVAIIGSITSLVFPKDGDSDITKNDDRSKISTQVSINDKIKDTSGEPDDKTIDGALDEPEDKSAVGKPVDDVVTMSDDLYDFTFKLEGVVYKLPCKLENLTSNGWTISSTGYDSDTKIAACSYDSFYMVKNERKIEVYSYNSSGNFKPIRECKVGGIRCEARDKVDFIIAKGITVLSTIDEIKTAFGVPGDSNKGSEYETMTYYAQKDSFHNSVKFRCDANNGSYIYMRNFIETEDDKTTTSTEKPDYLNEYKAPSAMGNNIKSNIVKIEGILYQLPAPVSVFIDNGWKIARQTEGVIAGGIDSMHIEKNGKKLDLYIKNYSEYQTTVENCAVYKVLVDNAGETNVSIGSETEFITIGTTKADVEAMVTDDFEYYEGLDYWSYGYSDFRERDFTLSIKVDKKTEKVYSITVSCDKWKY